MCLCFRSTFMLLQGQLGPKTTKSHDSIVFTSVCSTCLLFLVKSGRCSCCFLDEYPAQHWWVSLFTGCVWQQELNTSSSGDFFSREFLSVQDGVCMLRKAHMRSTLSLRSFPNVAFETMPVPSDWRWPFLVHSRNIIKCFICPCLSPLGNCWCLALCPQVVSEALLLSTPLSCRWSVVQCPWLCACR